MSDMAIMQIPVLSDNYVYLIHDQVSKTTACVDPAVSAPVIEAAEEQDWRITHVLVTHPHYDHTDGVADIVEAHGAEVYGSRHDFGEIPKCDHGLVEGDTIEMGPYTVEVLDVPGHTAHHVAYHIPDMGAVFVGDTLFSLGCGRLFGGTAGQMWGSLKKIRDLPPETHVFCAHEYTNANADFALSVDPDNLELIARAAEVLALRERGVATVPSTIASEIRCNPFLRCDFPAFKEHLGMANAKAEDVFAEVRKRKDNF